MTKDLEKCWHKGNTQKGLSGSHYFQTCPNLLGISTQNSKSLNPSPCYPFPTRSFIHSGAQKKTIQSSLILLTFGLSRLLSVLPSEYIWNPITSHHLQATTLVPATILSCLDHCNGFPPGLPASLLILLLNLSTSQPHNFNRITC